jgi:hypothetical protein
MLIYRLQFSDVFPEEEKKDLIDYLKNISKSTLEETISFLNKDDLPDYNDLFSNRTIRNDINGRVENFVRNKKLQIPICVFSTEANLYIFEGIIANRKQLLDENTLRRDTDRDELNIFKSILCVNQSLNEKEEKITLPNESNNMSKIAQVYITLNFSIADLGLYDDIKKELVNLLYVSFYKLKELINFLEQGKYKNYLDGIYNNFNVANQKELLTRVAELYVNVAKIVGKNRFFEVKDNNQQNFLDSLIAKEIKIEDDFVNIRNYPVYKKTDGTYIVLNPFFIMDKFTISLKFFLAKFFGNNIQGDFSNFYNKDFSEKFLMYNLFDSIFDYKYFVKKKTLGEEEAKDEPDYYFRYNNKIFIFEYKDILINKNVKVSRDIEIILSELKKKLLQNKTSDKGIGQLVKHINNIDNNEFPFDDRIKTNKSLKIYPILVLSDRKLEILGINYQFNQWFRDELGDLSHKNIKVQDLVVMSLDSFIVFKNKFKQNKENFRKMLDKQITEMKVGVKYRNIFEIEKKIQKKLLPFSARFINEGITDKDFKEMFREYC